MHRIPPTRHGMTLLEIMLVVAVLAMLAGLAWPAVLRYLVDHDLQRNVQAVRGELDRCRLKAVETGLIYQFRYEPGGRNFVILPEERPDTGSNMTNGDETNGVLPVVAGQLGADMAFGSLSESGTVAMPATMEKLGEEWLALLSSASTNVADVSWAPALLFYPDGSSGGGSVTLHDLRRQSVTLNVRNLTSAVTVDPVNRGAMP